MTEHDAQIAELNGELKGLEDGHNPERLIERLAPLSGLAVLAVSGKVYVPDFTKAFGNYVVTGDRGLKECEEVSFGASSVHGTYGYLLESARVVDDGRVQMTLEEYTERAYPRICFTNEVEFSIKRLRAGNLYDEREAGYLRRQARAGVLRGHAVTM